MTVYNFTQLDYYYSSNTFTQVTVFCTLFVPFFYTMSYLDDSKKFIIATYLPHLLTDATGLSCNQKV